MPAGIGSPRPKVQLRVSHCASIKNLIELVAYRENKTEEEVTQQARKELLYPDHTTKLTYSYGDVPERWFACAIAKVLKEKDITELFIID